MHDVWLSLDKLGMTSIEETGVRNCAQARRARALRGAG
jgi:hypothetical protein